jgi:hypothetical protein
MGSGGVLKADANARLHQFYYGDWEHRLSGKILAPQPTGMIDPQELPLEEMSLQAKAQASASRHG